MARGRKVVSSSLGPAGIVDGGVNVQSVSQSVIFIYKAHLKTTAVGQSAVQN